MSGQADKFKIGLFMVGSLILGVGLLVWLGAARYLAPSQTVVAYFSESVQGLDPDSPVKFRGVTVGRVKGIQMAPDAKLIEVVMALDPKFVVTADLGVKIGLLNLTGLKYLEMDRFGPEEKREIPTLDFNPRYPVITSYPSDIREFGTALENIFSKVKSVDVETISAHMLSLTAKLDRILSDTKVTNIGPDTAEAVNELKKAAKKINDEIDRMQPARRFGKTLDKASEFLDEATQTARSADRMIRRTDNNLSRLSQKLDNSADNLLDFTRMLRTKPSSILFGSPPEEKGSKQR